MSETTQTQRPQSETARPSNANGQDIVGKLKFTLHDDRFFGMQAPKIGGNLGSEGKYSGSVTMSATLGPNMTIMGAPRVTPDFKGGNGSHVKTVIQVHNDGTKPEGMAHGHHKYVYRAGVWYINDRNQTTPKKKVTEENTIEGKANAELTNGSGKNSQKKPKNSPQSKQRLKSLVQNQESASGQVLLTYLENQGVSVEDLIYSFDENEASIDKFVNQLEQQEQQERIALANNQQPKVQNAAVAAPAAGALIKKLAPKLLPFIGQFININFKLTGGISVKNTKKSEYTTPEINETTTYYRHYYDLEIWMTSLGNVDAIFKEASGSGNSDKNVYAETLEYTKGYHYAPDSKTGKTTYQKYGKNFTPGQLIPRNQNTWSLADSNNQPDRAQLESQQKKNKAGRVNMPLLK